MRTTTSFLSIQDCSPETILKLVNRSVFFARNIQSPPKVLQDKIIGLYFSVYSTRTRTSFTTAAMKLGAQTIAYGPHDLQMNTGETVYHTAKVLAGYIDGLVIRIDGTARDMKKFADVTAGQLAVVNAMSTDEHPSQTIADLGLIQEKFGSLAGRHILYLGEGNNTAAGLALAIAKIKGMSATFIAPKGYQFSEYILQKINEYSKKYGGIVNCHHDINQLPTPVDAVYNTRWQILGKAHTHPNWKDLFLPFRITNELMQQVSHSDTIYLHDLPAVPDEETAITVFDGPQSAVWRQAQYKQFSAMAILEWCLSPIS